MSFSVSSTSTSCAIAGRCNVEFVEPPIDTTRATAFSKAFLVRMSEGRMSLRSKFNTASPARRDDASLR